MFLLGFDIGSSSVKASLVDARTSRVLGTVQHPEKEMPISSPHPDWAEQDPDNWWNAVEKSLKKLLKKTGVKASDIASIGLSYQMHGLVCVDKNGEVLRPSIIWCDSRAVGIGQKAFTEIGEQYCLEHYLNSPGNFTASKLKWVKEHEPHIFSKIHKIMLPGDYIAYRLTGEMHSTISGLSEGILWDFIQNSTADRLLEYYGFEKNIIPDLAPSFGIQGKITASVAKKLGLKIGTPVTYRAGDQPNNALSLNVLSPGEVAATGGTSGVVYGVVGKPVFDPQNRVNSFAHINHSAENPRIGVLLCINGAGIQYSWVRQHFGGSKLPSYHDMEKMAAAIPQGSDGLRLIPFGNGAERVLGNRNLGAQVFNLQFNRHSSAHFYRAALEGVAFSFVYGVQVLKEMGLDISVMRVGNDNLFQSAIFSETIATLLGSRIEMLHTTGATGAAIASGVGIGVYQSPSEALGNLEVVKIYEPNHTQTHILKEIYGDWAKHLE